jgi:hypothetical protein
MLLPGLVAINQPIPTHNEVLAIGRNVSVRSGLRLIVMLTLLAAVLTHVGCASHHNPSRSTAR